MLTHRQRTMKKLILLIISVFILSIGYILGWITANQRNEYRLEQTITMKWGGDGAFYGVHVYLESINDGYSVRGRVYIGRGNDYFHDLGELGQVKTDVEAVDKWGQIRFDDDGVHIGNNGPNDFYFPKEKLLSHR